MAESVSNFEPGVFVLVSFLVLESSQFYAGHIRGPEKEPGMYEVKFLRRMAVKNPCPTSIRFHYPDEDDIQTVCQDKFVLTFDGAEVKKANKRQAK